MEITRRAERAFRGRHLGPAVRWLARCGYAAKGVLYAVVGVLAVELAVGRGGGAVGPRQSVVVIGRLPLGALWLSVLSVGLFGLAAWRFLQSLADVDERGTDARGWLARAGLLISGAIYAGFLFAALRWLLADHPPKRTPRSVEWTAGVMQSGWGRVLVVAVGVTLAIYGIAAIIRAVRGSFDERLDGDAIRRRWVKRVCRCGVFARGLVFVGIGWLVCQAAITFDPRKAAGVGAALATLAHEPYGSVLLGLAGLGLAAYAFYSFVEAGYRKLPG